MLGVNGSLSYNDVCSSWNSAFSTAPSEVWRASIHLWSISHQGYPRNCFTLPIGYRHYTPRPGVIRETWKLLTGLISGQWLKTQKIKRSGNLYLSTSTKRLTATQHWWDNTNLSQVSARRYSRTRCSLYELGQTTQLLTFFFYWYFRFIGTFTWNRAVLIGEDKAK